MKMPNGTLETIWVAGPHVAADMTAAKLNAYREWLTRNYAAPDAVRCARKAEIRRATRVIRRLIARQAASSDALMSDGPGASEGDKLSRAMWALGVTHEHVQAQLDDWMDVEARYIPGLGGDAPPAYSDQCWLDQALIGGLYHAPLGGR